MDQARCDEVRIDQADAPAIEGVRLNHPADFVESSNLHCRQIIQVFQLYCPLFQRTQGQFGDDEGVDKDLSVPAPRVGDIVRGKRAVWADTALRLGIYFGLPAQFWLNLQNEYDLRRAAKSPALKQVAPRAA
jgi:addiction module HigA family antidote